LVREGSPLVKLPKSA